MCVLWKVKKTRTTPYHPQGNSVVERGNKTLGDALRSLLLGLEQEGWDEILPQILRSFRSTPHTTTKETPNFMMMGREVRVPDQLMYESGFPDDQPTHQYVVDMQARMKLTHQLLRDQQ